MSRLEHSLIEELRSLYDAEEQLAKALPRFIKAAQNQELKHTFESYHEEVNTLGDHIERIFDQLDEPASARKCIGMQGLIAEADQHIKNDCGDAELICAFQKLKHYEIAAFGSLVAWATALGQIDAADSLRQILHEEKQEDEKLSDIGETTVNVAENSATEDRPVKSRFGISGRARRQSTGRKAYAAR